MFQNFDNIPHVTPGREAYYGGSVSLADYCPYIQEFIWRSKSVVIRGSHCQYPENNPRKLTFTLILTMYYLCILYIHCFWLMIPPFIPPPEKKTKIIPSQDAR